MTRIYHNPRCSKSRATLSLLVDQGIEVETVHYLDNPPRCGNAQVNYRRPGLLYP